MAEYVALEILAAGPAALEVAREAFQAGRILFQAGEGIVGKAVPMPFPVQQTIPVSKKTKIATDDDNKHVIKVNDALNCVQEAISDGAVLRALAQSILSLAVGSTLQAVGFPNQFRDVVEIIGTPIAKCMRAKQLPNRGGGKIPMAKLDSITKAALRAKGLSLKTTLRSRHG